MARVLSKAQCPRDFKPLKPLKINVVRGFDVTVDQCPNCEGMFLDRGEVKRVTGHDNLDELLTKKVGLDSDSELVCPGCGMVMDLEEAAGIGVEVCLSCHGVWLDAAELEQLKATPAERFGAFTPAKMQELKRAQAVKKQQRAEWWNQFLRRLAGRQ